MNSPRNWGFNVYALIFSSKAGSEVKKLSKNHQKAIIAAATELKDIPFLGKPLGRDLTGRRSLRVGVYRLIYTINVKDRKVTILSVGHRSVVYD
ncbi:MAG: type II toxin-antitoxin system RelE/ParE family toxin [Candidatus Levybacteria bacterium CG_4_10_14_0_2_um_filter_36_16]|nr:MAG: type II toxin-antitoxin system RelE/ParE family toxin [Candidatus Levybacteria bacterium CG_4_10_14_0_2_um_filter_36_16]